MRAEKILVALDPFQHRVILAALPPHVITVTGHGRHVPVLIFERCPHADVFEHPLHLADKY